MANKSVGLLTFNFGANMKGFNKAMNKAQRKLKKFGSSVKKMGSSMTMNLTLPIVALGAASVKAFDAQAKAIAQVEAGLKSTGNQVGLTSEELQKMARDLQNKTLFGDEEILKDATSQLLTFTNLTKENFQMAQVAALDLATKLDKDLKETTIQLGKALNDPILGITALGRSGIQFTKEQKGTITSLVKTNKLAEAQTLILNELKIQYGGSAEAAAKAGMGPIKQLTNQLSDMSEEIGKRLVPIIQSFVGWIKKIADKFDNLSSEQKDNIVKWGLIAAAIGPVLIVIGKMATGISALIGGLGGLAKFLTGSGAAWLVLAAGVALAAKGLYDYLTGANKVASKQDILNGINAKAEGAIVGQRLEVERLTEVLEDENSTLEVKTEALNKLKELSPEYYGQLKIAKGDVEGLTQATNDYIDSILEKAKAQAAEERLIEIEKELLNIETKRAKAGNEQGVAYKQAFIYTEKNRLALTEEKKVLSGLVKERMQDTEVIKEETKALEEQIKVEKEGGKKMRKVRPMRRRTPRLRLPKWTQEMVEEGMKPVEVKIHFNIIEWMSQGEKIAKVIEGWVDKWSDKIQGFADMASQALSSVAAVASALSNKETVEFENNKKRQEDALETSYNNELAMLEKKHMTEEEFTTQKEALDARYADSKLALEESMAGKEAAIKKKQAKRDKAIGIMSAIINTASAVVNTLAQLPFPANIVMASVIGGMGAAQIAIMASTPIPEFAEGGLVTGPTSALIGEASSASNPEVVAPLDKLKGFMAGAQQVEVVGTIQGTSIVLSSAKTNINRLRSV